MNAATNPIWHPFTQMKTATPPIPIERAKGCTLYAQDGKTYIDAISSWWVNIHGHSNDFIAAEIARQASTLEHVIFAGFTHAPAMTLAERLIRILPDNFSKIFFSDDGSTSVEVAIKIALQFWHNQHIAHKTKIIAFENAYHGDTFGAMSVGMPSVFTAPFQKHFFKVDFIPTPTSENIGDVKRMMTALIETGTVAAFLFEPLVQGAGGMLMHRADHLDELIALAQQHEVLCIADEVMTGFGRTGKIFAIDHLKNKPDLICLSKGITGGFLPMGVTACSEKIYQAFHSSEVEKTFFHGHSYTANPLACAAANASLTLLLSDQCQQQIKNIERSHAQFLEKIRDNKFVTNVRQTGTILALELTTNEQSSYFNSTRHTIYPFCLNEGVLLRPLGNVVYIMPPYCITPEELKKVYSVILKLIEKIAEK
ncbi:MAG: adenosylmethionine--8-amino-7-oxononanoate transaminase [Bacteroidetes bacterium]|nr:adenosylmethionine--8-amino-7-oxononanoate transaminase [Bacteroidota bacterium]MBS1541546.1 adenosylmethionine--8-amino-7-oxononanoate transaminase [Bacteroidota bacterium]